jgi:hypothetical protein
MAKESLRYPRILVHLSSSPLLREHAADRPWTLYAATTIRLAATGHHRKQSASLPVRLDTGAFVSALPEEWLRFLHSALILDPDPVPFGTAAARGSGRLARGVRTVFPEAPDEAYAFDWLVTPGLNGRGYGLLALRDILTYFTIRTAGTLQRSPAGIPSTLPVLELIPNRE